LAWVRRNLDDTPQIVRDGKRLGKILGTDRETLCRKQSRN
jgi:hypothetical protein